MANLDQIDRRLLAELQDEGRVTNVELAQRVGLTAPPCLRRARAGRNGRDSRLHADSTLPSWDLRSPSLPWCP
jgi:hypothetical protein